MSERDVLRCYAALLASRRASGYLDTDPSNARMRRLKSDANRRINRHSYAVRSAALRLDTVQRRLVGTP